MNCIIIEDQAPAQRVLKKYIEDLGTVELKACFNNAIPALEFLKSESVDLIFLDIHLPKISGIDFLKALPHPPAVILTTAFSDYAVQSYELDVVDYLVKPFSFQRFVKAVSKVSLSSPETGINSDGLDFFVKSGHEYIKVNSKAVLYIQSDMDYTELHLSGQKLLSPETLSHWEQKLKEQQFVRVHKSFLVNVGLIDRISGNQIFFENGETAPIGRAYKDGFLERFVRK